MHTYFLAHDVKYQTCNETLSVHHYCRYQYSLCSLREYLKLLQLGLDSKSVVCRFRL